MPGGTIFGGKEHAFNCFQFQDPAKQNNVNANQLAFTLPLLPELHKDAERLLRELRCHIKVFSQARVRPRLIEEG